MNEILVEFVPANFLAAVADPSVWLSVAVALVIGIALTAMGLACAAAVGLLDPGSPKGDLLGIGLGLGLLITSACSAAVMSGGRSVYVPVGVGFAVVLVMGVLRRGWLTRALFARRGAEASQRVRNELRSWIPTIAPGCLVVIAIGFIYGSTIAPSPRNGTQPVEFMDIAYYAILGEQLAANGTENLFAISGFDSLPGLPEQSWYHWGEIWLQAGMISLFDLEPVRARHYVVLPLILLASAGLTGTVVRKFAGSGARQAYVFGAACCLFLAPIPFVSDHFAAWARGLVFGITQYGLAAVAVLLSIVLLHVVRSRRSIEPEPAALGMVGVVVASVLPSHVGIAIVGLGATTVAMAIGGLQRRSVRQALAQPWLNLTLVSGAFVGLTLAWGFITGHGLGPSAQSALVSPFGPSWVRTLAMVVTGSGVLLAVLAVFTRSLRTRSIGKFGIAAVASIAFGAVAWGVALADFNMFHLFFAPLALFVTPAAAAAAWVVHTRLLAAGRRPLAMVLVTMAVLQLSIGAWTGLQRLVGFGPGAYAPIPSTILVAIEGLPKEAKLAYSCGSLEELAFWDPRLLSVQLHTGRPIIPMCHQGDSPSLAHGVWFDPSATNPYFAFAPQREIYPSSSAHPSEAQIRAFLGSNAIDYIYVDPDHPNALVQTTTEVASDGEFRVLRIAG